MAIANINPASITFKQTIVLSTTDVTTSNSIIEGYTVSGPSSPGVAPIFIAGGTKAVIPLSTATGNGAPYLKITFPAPGSNVMYLTYCVANSQMADGYYDYQMGVPFAFFVALVNWTTALFIPPPLTGGVMRRALKFSAYGASTNQPSKATTFYISFTNTAS